MFRKSEVAVVLSFLLISSPAYSGGKGKKDEPTFKAATSTETNTLNYDEYKFGANEADQEVRFKPLNLENKSAMMRGPGRDQRPYGVAGSVFSRNYSLEQNKMIRPGGKGALYAEKLSLAAAQTGYSGGGILTKTNGAIIAVCDGGFSDEVRTEGGRKTVHDSSQKACSLALEKINQFTDPDTLRSALNDIIEEIEKAVPGAEKISLTLGKAFRQKDGRYRYVGVNLGSSGVIGVRQDKGAVKIESISPPVSGQSKTFDVTVPAGTILTGLSFGAYEFLGYKEKENREWEINGEKLAQRLGAQKLSPHIVVDAIKTITVEATQNCRRLNVYKATKADEARVKRLEECIREQRPDPKFFRETREVLERLQTQGSDFMAIGITLP